MAVSGVGRSTSIYGNRNVITGLVSGMDTEGMIENAISAYKNKITALQQNRTKTEWKQEAYRSIINKMSLFSEKYTSYRSANNLMSTSFFDQAVKTVTKGKYADMVSAIGRASSNIQINGVKQLATSSSFTLSGAALDKTTSSFGGDKVEASASDVMDLDKMMEVGGLNGTLTLAYGGKNDTSYLTINLDETMTFKDDVDADGNVIKSGAEKLAEEINKQLEGQSVSIGTKTYTGKELLDNIVKAEVNGGSITFSDPKGNNVYVAGASGNLKDQLLGGQEPSSKDGQQIKSLRPSESALKTEEMSTFQYLMSRGGSMEITLDGKTKTIKLPSASDVADKVDSSYKYADALKTKIKNGEKLNSEESQKYRDAAFMAAFQDKVDEAFGKNADGSSKLKVSDAEAGAGIQFKFETAQKGSTFSVYSTKGEVLGFGDSKQVTSYLNTGKSLKDIMGDVDWSQFDVARTEKGTVAVDDNGDTLYSFKVNGKEIGQFNENSTLRDVMNAMNSNSDSDVKVGYSKLTNNLTFSTKETGEGGQIKFDGLSAKLFGFTDASTATAGKFTAGQDAIFTATVNGEEIEMTRSSNDVNLDGMTVTLKGTFGYDESGKLDKTAEAVSFETSSDADKIVDVVKQMVEDYNAMAKEIKDAYSTLPAQRSNGAYYEPLTAEEEEGETESFIKNWTEKAKQGILFGDRDLASLYQRLTSAVSMTGENGAALREAGITVSYSNGLSTLEFNETKFRAALNSDPDKVRDAFTASTEAGAKSNGLMQALKQPLDVFGKTSGGKGVLVEKAGSPLAPSTMYNNTIQKELNRIDEEIERWQDKMTDQVDYYTNQFSRLEQLIQQMNSQSSYFSQLMGG